MGLVYNVKDRRYDVSYEKTDFTTNYQTNYETQKTFHIIWNRDGYITYFSTNAPNANNFRNAGGSTAVNVGTAPSDQIGDYADVIVNQVNSAGARNAGNYAGSFRSQYQTNNSNQQKNQVNAALNQANRTKNQTNQRYNDSYDTVLRVSQGTQGGDYVTQRQLVRDITGVPQSTVDQLQTDFKRFYQTEKLVPWDNKQGALDPLGKFDPTY